MLILGSILALAGGIAALVFWIMALVKAFKANDILWGVLGLVLGPLLALIWLFMKGHNSLAMKLIIAGVVYIIGFVLMAAGGAVSVNVQ